jgi:hypothetical protein
MKTMPEQNFSAEESLQLIQSMIIKAKQHVSGRAIYFLLWGCFCCLHWTVFIEGDGIRKTLPCVADYFSVPLSDHLLFHS